MFALYNKKEAAAGLNQQFLLWVYGTHGSAWVSPCLIRDLTHISLASFLWDIGKQNSPRCNAANVGMPSGAILFAYTIFIRK